AKRASAASRLSPASCAEAPKRSVMMRNSSTAPPRRWVYCWSKAGSCAAPSPTITAPTALRYPFISAPRSIGRSAVRRRTHANMGENHGNKKRGDLSGLCRGWLGALIGYPLMAHFGRNDDRHAFLPELEHRIRVL